MYLPRYRCNFVTSCRRFLFSSLRLGALCFGVTSCVTCLFFFCFFYFFDLQTKVNIKCVLAGGVCIYILHMYIGNTGPFNPWVTYGIVKLNVTHSAAVCTR
ncbi:uncharacterized protein GGS25DRAFT_470771 [Hypoxylon fragiforme]|uniref:uncharacterized protein n=1 Tax=Hypoxylon fragiforme TaxID=63214 RepID=UPI0020C6A5A7|nr:uncharacterized protein GGS25DRAFT_470771 [Hypoxylon fragiforme]KAI2614209.1 hypothetical protein GGS25DRAFT_470771 [Hypoxylon fragiforme]